MHLIVVFSEKFSLRTVARSKLEVQRLVEATTQNQSGRWLAHFFGSSKAVAPVFEKHFFFVRHQPMDSQLVCCKPVRAAFALTGSGISQ